MINKQNGGQLLLYGCSRVILRNETDLMSAISPPGHLWLDGCFKAGARLHRAVFAQGKSKQREQSGGREGGGAQRVQRDPIQNGEIITARTSIKVLFLTHYCCSGVARLLLSVSRLLFCLSGIRHFVSVLSLKTV